MKMTAILATALTTMIGEAVAQERQTAAVKAPADVRHITPELADYTEKLLFGQVWERPGLSHRDRSVVTVAALIAGGKTAQLTGHLNRALDNGVKPGELTAAITHLAFYSGWPNAISAVTIAKDVFDKRGIAQSDLVAAADERVKLDAKSEARRAASVDRAVGTVIPGLATYTNDVLFGDLWRRPDLSPRDRSLVTISSLIATGEAAQLPFHLSRGIDNGLTKTEISETITHLAFYAGWPKAMSAVPLAKAAFEGVQSPAPARKAEGEVEILRSGSQPDSVGAPENFTGKVRVGSRFQRTAPARISGGIVTFEPGAHTAWHTHPLGQTLIVVTGAGLVQHEGGNIQTMSAGDVVWIPPGVKHWHGASASSGMSHIAIAEAQDGKSVDWLEKVTDEQYRMHHGASQPKMKP
ncbi:4-carboxymuconolactone decarboxylase [Bradyrhizobium sp. NFR13]|uniref:(R)-mandelonitrile lyase n=1 Tax=Bradyrhizobium sp. NFR13 TaxID=1566285 RepID=UPI0008EC5087|nr:carboxymuconolactone decarboxylase family protein [Bradyrhizobium sp. NFR13]SFL96779.1 4-carboxymuconolactone decarboxylase [Bradyrhizobium sp. NFR13]